MLYNVVLASPIQQSEEAINIQISPLFFWISFPCRSPQLINARKSIWNSACHKVTAKETSRGPATSPSLLKPQFSLDYDACVDLSLLSHLLSDLRGRPLHDSSVRSPAH